MEELRNEGPIQTQMTHHWTWHHLFL